MHAYSIELSDFNSDIRSQINKYNAGPELVEEDYEVTVDIETSYLNREKNTKTISYFLSKTVGDGLFHAKNELDLKHKVDHIMICILPTGKAIVLDRNKKLGSYPINEECYFVIVPPKLTVKITSKFQPEVTPIEIDPTLTVAELAAFYLKDFGIEITHDYSILQDDELLTRNTIFGSIVDEQSIYTVYRRYFVISREDISSLQLAKQTYNSIMSYIGVMEVYPTSDQIVELAYFSYVIDNPQPKIANISSGSLSFIPGVGSIEKYIKKIVKTYQKWKTPDPINCYRNFIRVMRQIPGFGATYYKGILKQDSKGSSHTETATIVLAPMEIIIATKNFEKAKKDDDEYCLRLYFASIKFATQDENEVTITYFDNKKEDATVTIQFRSEVDAHDFNLYVVENVSIIRSVFKSRSERKARGEKIDLCISLDRITLKTISAIRKKYQIFQYDRDLTGKQLAEKAADNLDLEYAKDEYAVMVIKSKQEDYWLDPDKPIYDQDVYDNYIILVCKPVVIMKFHNVNTIKTLKIDLRMTCDEISKVFMQKIGLPPLDGYALYCKENGTYYPLYPDSYIPSQTNDYKELWFKRRLYLITNELASSKNVRQQIIRDCFHYIMENPTSITLQQAVDLAIYYRYAFTTDIDEVMKDDGSLLANYIPTKIMNKGINEIKNLYLETLKSTPKMNNINAARFYIKLVKKIPEFGAEAFDIKWGETRGRIDDLSSGTLYVSRNEIIFCKKNQNIKDGVIIDLVKMKHLSNRITHMEVKYFREKKKDATEARYVVFIPLSAPGDANPFDYISKLIYDSQKYMKDLRRMRKLSKRRDPVEAALHVSGKYVDENGVQHPPEIDLFIGDDLNFIIGLDKLWFPLTYNYKQLIEKCKEVLGFVNKKETFIPILYIQRKPVFMSEDQTLADLKIVRPSYVFIIPSEMKINIKFNMNYHDFVIPSKMKVTDLILQACAYYEIVDPWNYNLVCIADNRVLMNRSVAEQVNANNNLMLKRQYFNFYNGLPTGEPLTIIYKDIRQNFINQTINLFTTEDIIKVAVLGAIIDKRGNISDLNLQTGVYCPKESVPKNYDAKKIIKEFNENYKFTDIDKSMKDYCEMVLNLKTFSAEGIPCKFEGKETVIFLDRNYLTFVTARPPYQELLCLKWNQVIKISHIQDRRLRLDETTIIYTDDSNIQHDQQLYLSNVMFLKEPLNKKIEDFEARYRRNLPENFTDADITPETEVYIQTCYRLETRSDTTGKKIRYDIRFNKQQIIETAMKAFGLVETNFEVYITLSNIKREAYKPDKFLGSYFINDKTSIHLMSTNRYITVENEEGKKYSLTVSITSEVRYLLKKIAHALGNHYHLGCELFAYDEAGNLFPLKPKETIINQTQNFNFVIKRTFYALSSYDLRDELVVNQIFPIVKEDLYRGDYQFTTSEVVHFMLYLVIIETGNKQVFDVFNMTEPREYIPHGYRYEDADIIEIFNESKMKMNYVVPLVAMQKFIIDAFRITGFGMHRFQVKITYVEDDNAVERHCTLELSSNGMNLINNEMSYEFKAFRCSWEDVVTIESTKSRIHVDFTVPTTRQFYEVFMYADEIKEIEQYMNMFKHVVVPQIKTRSAFQNKYYDTIDSILQSRDEKLQVCVLPAIGSTQIRTIEVLYRFNGSDVKELLANLYNIEDTSDHSVYMQRRSNMEFINMPDEITITEMKVEMYDIFYLIDTMPEIYVKFPSGDRIRDKLYVTRTVEQLVFDQLNNIKSALSDGFTMYKMDGDAIVPLHHYSPLIAAHQKIEFYNDIIIQQRVFLFSPKVVDDKNTMRLVFEDMYQLFRNGKVQNMTNDDVIKLTAASLYMYLDKFDPKTFSVDVIMQYLPINFTDEKVYAFILKEFRQYSNDYKQEDMIYLFISIMVTIPDFGSEYYNVQIHDGYNFVPCQVKVNPYMLTITNSQNNAEVLKLEMHYMKNVKLQPGLLTLCYTNPRDADEIVEFHITSDQADIIADYFRIYLELMDQKTMYPNPIELSDYLRSLFMEGVTPQKLQSLDYTEFAQQNHDTSSIMVPPEIDFGTDFDEQPTIPEIGLIDFNEYDPVPVFQNFDTTKIAAGYATAYRTNANTNTMSMNMNIAPAPAMEYMPVEPLPADFLWMLELDFLGHMRVLHSLSSLVYISQKNISGIFANDKDLMIKRLKHMLNVINKDYPRVNPKSLQSFEAIENTIKSAIDYISSHGDLDMDYATKQLESILELANLFIGEIQAILNSLQFKQQQHAPFTQNQTMLLLAINNIQENAETLIEAYNNCGDEYVRVDGLNCIDVNNKIMQHMTSLISFTSEYIRSRTPDILVNKIKPLLATFLDVIPEAYDFNNKCTMNQIIIVDQSTFLKNLKERLISTDALIVDCMTEATSNVQIGTKFNEVMSTISDTINDINGLINEMIEFTPFEQSALNLSQSVLKGILEDIQKSINDPDNSNDSLTQESVIYARTAISLLISDALMRPELENQRMVVIGRLNELDIGLLSISTINIVPQKIKEILNTIDIIVSESDKVRGVPAISNLISDFSSGLRDIKFMLENYNKVLENQPFDNEVVKNIQNTLKQLYLNIHQTIPMLASSLEAEYVLYNSESIKQAIINVCTDEIIPVLPEDSQHVEEFHKLQQKLSEIISQNKDQKNLISLYFKTVEQRGELHRDPLNERTIKHTKKLVEEISSHVNLSETQTCIDALDKAISLSKLNNKQVPTKELVAKSTSAVKLYAARISQFIAPRVNAFFGAKNISVLENECSQIGNITSEILQQEQFPSPNFFNIVSNFDKHIKEFVENLGSDLFNRENGNLINLIRSELRSCLQTQNSSNGNLMMVAGEVMSSLQAIDICSAQYLDEFSMQDIIGYMNKLKNETFPILSHFQSIVQPLPSNFMLSVRYHLMKLIPALSEFEKDEAVVQKQNIIMNLRNCLPAISRFIKVINNLPYNKLHSSLEDVFAVEEVNDYSVVSLIVSHHIISYSKTIADVLLSPYFLNCDILKFSLSNIYEKIKQFTAMDYLNAQNVIDLAVKEIEFNKLLSIIKCCTPISRNTNMALMIQVISNNLELLKKFNNLTHFDSQQIPTFQQTLNQFTQYIRNENVNNMIRTLLSVNDGILMQQLCNRFATILETEIQNSFSNASVDSSTRENMIQVYHFVLRYASRAPHKTSFASTLFMPDKAFISEYANEIFNDQNRHEIDIQKVIGLLEQQKNLPLFIASDVADLKQTITSKFAFHAFNRVLALSAKSTKTVLCCEKALQHSFEKLIPVLADISQVFSNMSHIVKSDGVQHDPNLLSFIETCNSISSKWSNISINLTKDIIDMLRDIKLIQFKLPFVFLYSQYDQSIQTCLNKNLLTQFYYSFIEVSTCFYNLFFSYITEFISHIESSKLSEADHLRMITKLCNIFATTKRILILPYIKAHEVFLLLKDYVDNLHKSIIEKTTNSHQLYLKLSADVSLINDAMSVFEPMESIDPTFVAQVSSMYGMFILDELPLYQSLFDKSYLITRSITCINSIVMFKDNPKMATFSQFIDYMNSLKLFVEQGPADDQKVNQFAEAANKGFNAIMELCRGAMTADGVMNFAQLASF